jgi:hypothetical protein
VLIAQRWPARQSAFLFLAELNAVVRVLVLVIELNVVSGPAGPELFAEIDILKLGGNSRSMLCPAGYRRKRPLHM